jgi:hypothetical protein
MLKEFRIIRMMIIRVVAVISILVLGLVLPVLLVVDSIHFKFLLAQTFKFQVIPRLRSEVHVKLIVAGDHVQPRVSKHLLGADSSLRVAVQHGLHEVLEGHSFRFHILVPKSCHIVLSHHDILNRPLLQLLDPSQVTLLIKILFGFSTSE